MLIRRSITTGYEVLGLELYDKVLQSTSFNQEEVENITRRLKDTDRVLVVRVALGDVIREFIKQGKKVYGIDHDQRCLDYTRQKTGHCEGLELSLVKEDLSDFIKSNEFSAATCASIHWYGQGREAESVCSRVYQALKPNGIFVVTGIAGKEIDRSLELGKEEAEQSSIILSESETQKVQKATRGYPPALRKIIQENFSVNRTKQLLEKAGFDIVAQEGFYHNTHYVLVGKKI